MSVNRTVRVLADRAGKHGSRTRLGGRTLRPDKDVTDARLVKALAHPLRVRILGVLDERMASPSELAEELDAPLGNVSYHVRILASLGLIRLVSEMPRRGSVEHYYESDPHPLLSAETWSVVPQTFKPAALESAANAVRAAVMRGGFERRDALLARGAWNLDPKGWRALADAGRALLAHAEDIRRAAEARIMAGESEPELATLLLMLFPTAPEVPRRDAPTAESSVARAG